MGKVSTQLSILPLEYRPDTDTNTGIDYYIMDIWKDPPTLIHCLIVFRFIHILCVSTPQQLSQQQFTHIFSHLFFFYIFVSTGSPHTLVENNKWHRFKTKVHAFKVRKESETEEVRKRLVREKYVL